MNCKRGRWRLLASLVMLAACIQKPETSNTATGPTVMKPAVVQPASSMNPYEAVDVSPLDISYYPVHYPLQKMSGNLKEGPVMRVLYSRPHLQGRSLFGSVLKYDQPWRMGANEATELDVFKPVLLNNKQLQPGRYKLYAIPHEKSWTLVLNSELDTWGLHQDSTRDILRTEVPATDNNPMTEYFTMIFEKTNRGADLLIAWDKVLVRLPFVIK